MLGSNHKLAEDTLGNSSGDPLREVIWVESDHWNSWIFFFFFLLGEFFFYSYVIHCSTRTVLCFFLTHFLLDNISMP